MINKMFLKDLKKFILTSIDPDIKDVCYTGIAHAIIDKMEITDTVIANRTLFISLVDEIGEDSSSAKLKRSAVTAPPTKTPRMVFQEAIRV